MRSPSTHPSLLPAFNKDPILLELPPSGAISRDSVRFSPDGKILVAGTDYGFVYAWDAATFEPIWDLRTDLDYPYAAFQRDPTALRIYSDFDFHGPEVAQFEVHLHTGNIQKQRRVSCVWSHTSPNHRWSAHRFDTAKGGRVAFGPIVNHALWNQNHGDYVEYFAMSPCGTAYFTHTQDQLFVWSTTERRITRNVQISRDIRAIAISPNRSWVATLDASDTLVLTDTMNGAELGTHRLERCDAAAIAWSNSGEHLIVLGTDLEQDPWMVVFSCTDQKPRLNQPTQHSAKHVRMTDYTNLIRVDGNVMLVLDSTSADLYDISSQRHLWSVKVQGFVQTAVLRKDLGWALIWTRQGRYKIDLRSGESLLDDGHLVPYPTLQFIHENPAIDALCVPSGCFAWGINEETMYTTGENKVEVWDLNTHKRTRTFSTPGDTITSISCSPDGRCVATSGHHDVHIMRAQCGTPIARYTSVNNSYLHAPVWSPDGRWIAVAHTDPSGAEGSVAVYAGDPSQTV